MRKRTGHYCVFTTPEAGEVKDRPNTAQGVEWSADNESDIRFWNFGRLRYVGVSKPGRVRIAEQEQLLFLWFLLKFQKEMSVS